MAMADVIRKEYGYSKSHDIAKQAALMWKMEHDSVKEKFKQQADIEFEEHKKKYPHYIWPSGANTNRLVKKKGGKRRNTTGSLSSHVSMWMSPQVFATQVVQIPTSPLYSPLSPTIGYQYPSTPPASSYASSFGFPTPQPQFEQGFEFPFNTKMNPNMITPVNSPVTMSYPHSPLYSPVQTQSSPLGDFESVYASSTVPLLKPVPRYLNQPNFLNC